MSAGSSAAAAEAVSALAEATRIASQIHDYINRRTNPKGNTMPVLTPIATVDTVTIEKVTKVNEKQYTLRLSELQAGYVLGLLYGAVAGEVASYVFYPLASALQATGAKRLYANNTNKEKHNSAVGYYYTSGYAVLDFKDDAAREAAGAPKKLNPIYA